MEQESGAGYRMELGMGPGAGLAAGDFPPTIAGAVAWQIASTCNTLCRDKEAAVEMFVATAEQIIHDILERRRRLPMGDVQTNALSSLVTVLTLRLGGRVTLSEADQRHGSTRLEMDRDPETGSITLLATEHAPESLN